MRTNRAMLSQYLGDLNETYGGTEVAQYIGNSGHIEDKLRNLIKWASTGTVHLTGILFTTAFAAWTVLPVEHMKYIGETIRGEASLVSTSILPLAIHVGLSICVWVLLYIAYSYVAILVRERRSPSGLVRATGSVMTETLIIMPIFMLLTFGMAQLAINNITGILANVAVYEAARSAWVWKPEESAAQRRMGVTDTIAEEKARVAVALVMLPIAPGDFVNNPVLDNEYATQMRLAAGLSHIPFGGAVLTGGGDDAQQLAELGAAGFSLDATRATSGNRSFWRALDGGSSFRVRTVKKFTHAFHASSVEIADDHSVTMVYQHQIAMPFVAPIFGEEQSLFSNFSTGVGLREGYYASFNRTFGFGRQTNVPNGFLPSNDLENFVPPPSGEAAAEGGLDAEAGVPDESELPENNPAPPPDPGP